MVNLRQVFVETLKELAREDKKIILIVMDVGFSYIESFQEEFPDQFLNLGVTEQSSMGIAAGMALSGYKVYIYSMIPFVTFRNYEQLRNDVVLHHANVKIIGVQGSVHYKFLGFSHNMIIPDEDKKILKHLLPTVVPKHETHLKKVMKESYENQKPIYIRL